MDKKRIAIALALIVPALVLMLQRAPVVEAREMLHPCPDPDDESQSLTWPDGSVAVNCNVIGPDGATQTGPYLPSVSDLAVTYPSAMIESVKNKFRQALNRPQPATPLPPVIELYSGVNPVTAKPVLIDYLREEELLRVSTYYPDTPAAANKPYIFTLNQSNQVEHLVW